MPTAAPPPSLAAIATGVEIRLRDLLHIETDRWAAFDEDLQTPMEHIGRLVLGGGKRLRPALLILTNFACGGDGSSKSVVRLATVMEMLHTATLVHDDIIDGAAVRRNRTSVNAKFGNQTAVLMGDSGGSRAVGFGSGIDDELRDHITEGAPLSTFVVVTIGGGSAAGAAGTTTFVGGSCEASGAPRLESVKTNSASGS